MSGAARPPATSRPSIWHGLCQSTDLLVRLAGSVARPVLRVALAVPFFRSGLTRWDGFLSLAPSAEYLFEEEFKLHLFGGVFDIPAPLVVAHLTSLCRDHAPGSACDRPRDALCGVGLLAMVGVIQLVVPDGWANFHLPWAALAIAIVALGAGPLSLDALILRLWPRRTPVGQS